MEVLITLVLLFWVFSFVFGIVTICKARMSSITHAPIAMPETIGTDEFLRNAESFMEKIKPH